MNSTSITFKFKYIGPNFEIKTVIDAIMNNIKLLCRAQLFL